MASDDWRVQVDFVDEGPVDALRDRLDAQELEHDLSEAFGEDAAKALAERIRSEAPPGSKVSVEATFKEIADDIRNPFAFLGGLGN